MSRELEKAAKVALDSLEKAPIRSIMQRRAMNLLREALDSAPKKDEPVDISDKFEPTIGSILILPNGAVVSNVYEAYEAGLKEKTRRDEEPIYQISLTTGRAKSSAWIDVTKDQYDDAGMYPEYARRTVHFHPAPRPEFVRLSEEEIMAIVRADPDFDEMMWDCTSIRFARSIEDALEEKNTINKSDPDSIDLQSRCRGDKL